ncbi:serine hydrolase [Spirillospora sp. CA-294931]|uniref:D-alanyl-D-alanine carboxypeptidase family protein n=1 Tax=Spirillospora sp. CA-294931 TaxID=3240042 RepID=UPI003D95050F
MRPSQARQALQGGVPQETALDLPSQNQQVPQEGWQQAGWGQDAQSPWPGREEHGSWGQEQQSPASSGAWAVEPVEEAPPKKRRRTGLIALVAALVLVGGVVAGQLVRPVPEPSVELVVKSSHTFQGSAPRLPWPTQGQSAVYVEGLGSMGASGAKAPTPTASVAKVMTAYVFLRDHPLGAGQAGPTYTVSQQSAVEMPGRKRRGESILGIVPNQRLTERKALEALMVISANDVAVELARWDSGNVPAFVRKMNEAARALGMTSTRYTDPSGYDRGTVSTAADQVKLLRAAMAVPAFAETVNKAAYEPDNGAPATRGGNTLLGQLGVIGGKTGYTDAAGGNFVFAAKKRVGGVETTILGAVMGQRSPNAQGAIEAARTLVAGAGRSLVSTVLAPAGSTVAEVDDGLGGKTPLTASTPVTVVGWPGLTVPVSVTGEPPRVAASGERIGNVKTGAGSVPLVAGGQLSEPSLVKRLTRVS